MIDLVPIPEKIKGMTSEDISLWLNTLKKDVTEREMDIATKRRILAILKGLSEGTPQQRFITALRNVPESLYRQVYPRRYRPLQGYWEPKYTLLLAAWHHYSVQALEMREEEGWDLRALIAEGVPTYYLSAKAVEAFEGTDAAEVLLACDDFDWPHEAFQVVMPKRNLESEPMVIVFARNSQWARFSWVVSNRKFCMGDVEMPVSLSIAEGLALYIQHHDLPGRNVRNASLAINILLAMVAEPEFDRCRGASHSKPDAHGIQHLELNESWTPNVLDFAPPAAGGDQGDSSAVGSGGSKRPHARRAHWRTRWVHDTEMILAPGSHAIWLGDQRKTLKVVSISGLVATVQHQALQELPTDELRPAKVKLTWVRKSLIGLKPHLSPTTTP